MIQFYFAVGAAFVIYLVTDLLRKKKKTNRVISIGDKKCARCNSCIIHLQTVYSKWNLRKERICM